MQAPATSTDGRDNWPDLYNRLREIASRQMNREKKGHLLQTTAVVHEAWLRLSQNRSSPASDRESFVSAAAVVMRRVLVDFARSENAAKRGGGRQRTALANSHIAVGNQGYHAVEINDALEQLAAFAPEQARALELMIFGGMTGEEVASTMDISASTIDRRVRAAKAWLRRELSDPINGGGE